MVGLYSKEGGEFYWTWRPFAYRRFAPGCIRLRFPPGSRPGATPAAPA